ncbi:glutamine--tRNA ligase/YqeY domain fusion protein [Gammaproteobacteria bacterium]|nr:glutamine--tRNA ligase/YqeY domain fusion protein [Gammaproteobacteria bacterium]
MDQENGQTGGNDFIRQRIKEDVNAGILANGVVTRFPPEPNGFLHIGHAKSICLNFGVALEFGGKTYLRFDDTNPEKEDETFVRAILEDVKWLGFDWAHLTYASDYFEELYGFAEGLIRDGKAFVCSLTGEEIRKSRGSLTEAGENSPYRERSVEENLGLFKAMKDGEFEEGAQVLRLKIDMSSPNINLRDPVIYRIRYQTHQRTGDRWCIYPMYDYTHCICDALENISHSLCTLEFEDHRPLYDWVLENVNLNYHPPQIEFSRLGLEYTVMSKRLLSRLVSERFVEGWDDPRMPTIAGLRRRGVPASAIREFCSRVGVTKQSNLIEMELLEFCVRKDLESSAPRAMCVLEPLEVVITNWEGPDLLLEAPWHPKQESLGSRDIPFSGKLYIEKDDFSIEPPSKWKRLFLGGLIRLRYGFIIRCDEVIHDEEGMVKKLRCTYFPDSRSGQDKSGLKPKGVIHWISSATARNVKVRRYNRLFTVASPAGEDFVRDINADSLIEYDSLLEPAAVEAPEQQFQFERLGYFSKDRDAGAFNQTVSLREGS